MSELFRRLLKAAKLVRVPVYFQALTQGAAAAIEHEDVLRSLDCDLVVDVGANKGQFALAARRNFPASRILSFEPLDQPAAIFRRVFAGDPKTELHQVAIGSAEGKHVMHVSARDDSSSLLPISELQNDIFPGTSQTGDLTISVAPLTKYLSQATIPHSSLLKIDVQGFEMEVLEGCGELLQGFEHVYVECSFMELYVGQAFADDIIGYLRARGFALSGVYNLANNARGIAVQGDFLFSHAGSR